MVYVLLVVIVLLLLEMRFSASSRNMQVTHPSSGKVVLDTSALIDGRIVDVVKTGFLSAQMIVPSIVLRELQLLADGKDHHKRERARSGLDTVAILQTEGSVSIYDATFTDTTTDDALLLIAKKLHASVCTTDFNLNKVASVEGLVVLNINELAQMLRPKVLPGEIVEVKILQKGEMPSQGVGYLEDGTMVVVDGASRLKGKTTKVEVDRMIQTKAGKMIFGKLAAA